MITRSLSNKASLHWLRLSLLLVIALAGVSPRSALAQSNTYCAPGQSPQFVLGFAFLKSQLGATMGDPLECEHYDPAGNALQTTTTGVARWEKATNTLSFTAGTTQWTWTSNGLVQTTVPAATPAPSALTPTRTTSAPVIVAVGATLGTVTVTPLSGSQVQIQVEVAGFRPTRPRRETGHWLGITQVGVCTPPDFGSAGRNVLALPPFQFYRNGSGYYSTIAGADVLAALSDADGGAIVIRADDRPRSRIIGCAPVVLITG